MLDEILARYQSFNLEQKKEFKELVDQAVPEQIWYPEPSNKPQVQAYYSKADILLYGGQPGGGKTALLLGTASTQHRRSLIVRKQFTDLDGLVDNLQGMIGTSKGIVRGNRPKYRSEDGRLISFQGMGSSGELDTGKQGNAFDFIGVDEAAQLPENDIRLLIGWNRVGAGVPSTQRCRVILASNPPVDSVGDWLAAFFAPWLDDKHPNPAKHGELRWFYFDREGKSIETENTKPFEVGGEMVYPHSRTYIPAKVEDNPYINAEEYKRNLQSIPEPYRTMLTSGNFLVARQDQQAQVIPTAWVRAAFQRWEAAKGLPPEGIPMCNIGLDCSGGGNDEAVIAPRYDHFFGKLTKFKTVANEYGSQMTAEVIKVRRDRSHVTPDMGGGYGSGVWLMLKDNIGSEFLISYKGGEAPTRRTQDGKLSYWNLRSQAYWEFREALNPDQVGGSHIALPPDPRLLAGLTAPTFEIQGIKIKVETKDKVVEKLKYSPNEADAVVMAWYGGRKGLIPETIHRPQLNRNLNKNLPDRYSSVRNLIRGQV